MLRELIVIGQNAPPYRHPLTTDRIIIGRSSTCTLCFPDDPSLSRQHTVILQNAGAWFVADLGSKKGTSLNGTRVEGDVQLAEGDRIEVGSLVIICAGDEDGRRSTVEIPAAAVTPGPVITSK